MPCGLLSEGSGPRLGGVCASGDSSWGLARVVSRSGFRSCQPLGLESGFCGH